MTGQMGMTRTTKKIDVKNHFHDAEYPNSDRERQLIGNEGSQHNQRCPTSFLGHLVFAERQNEKVIFGEQLGKATVVSNQRGYDAKSAANLANPIALLEIGCSCNRIYQSSSSEASQVAYAHRKQGP
jgi:hypothetical protein